MLRRFVRSHRNLRKHYTSQNRSAHDSTLQRVLSRKPSKPPKGAVLAGRDLQLPESILVANRGEIANRIFETASRLGLRTVAVYTEEDFTSTHTRNADVARLIPSYLDIDALIKICIEEDIECCLVNGITFLGPSGDSMEKFSMKHHARDAAKLAGVAVVPGSDVVTKPEAAVKAASLVGYPIMLKAVSGGGGIGMIKCDTEEELLANWESTVHQAKQFFSDDRMYIEKFVQSPRHIEVQIFGNGAGKAIHLGERECSIQRRNQKIIEEAPSPFVEAHPELRDKLTKAAIQLAESVEYNSAGTVEFLVDGKTAEFYFLEMNTRLQVEHPITEAITGIDLVEWMIRQGARVKSERPNLERFKTVLTGHAIEARLYCEDPLHDFAPTPGQLTKVKWPSTDIARVDTWVERGTHVTSKFDPLIAKLIVHGSTRGEAIMMFRSSLATTELIGTITNLRYVSHIANKKFFSSGVYDTGTIEGITDFEQIGIDVVHPGVFTTIQDWPGRIKNVAGTDCWRVGIPPSGPMDAYAFRAANRLVSNDESAAGLEITAKGPILDFNEDAVIALTGAEFEAYLDDIPVPLWESFLAPKGSQLVVKGIRGNGYRGYLAVSGGFNVPDYMGSRSTFTLGRFGGSQGRPLVVRDNLTIQRVTLPPSGVSAPPELQSKYLLQENKIESSTTWNIGVLPGPQESPDFVTVDGMDIFYSSDWEVHHSSNRVGVRLNGPKLSWSRTDGGGAGGSHPSNVLDNEYAVGTINVSGDMPIAIMVDGPSLGGFVCVATMPKCEIWKMGQIKPNDKLRFYRINLSDALKKDAYYQSMIASIGLPLGAKPTKLSLPLLLNDDSKSNYDAVLLHRAEDEKNPSSTCRMQGCSNVLYEYGSYNEKTIDLEHRFRVHELEKLIHNWDLPENSILETSPGIRSLQINYDNSKITLPELLSSLESMENELPNMEDVVIESREVHLPIVLDDKWSLEALEKYSKTVRSEAPYLPNNLEFVARANGLLGGIEEAKKIILDASYLVLGLGDVFLGCPAALPVDPRHRLVCPKFNPARTYTPEGAVGIGGAFMCLYPTESPGGYQLIGRSLPIWNTYCVNENFEVDKPWLLRMFDRVKFYEVDEQELESMIEPFRNGLSTIQIQNSTFSLGEYKQFLNNPVVQNETETFQYRQIAANAIELEKENLYQAMLSDENNHEFTREISILDDETEGNEHYAEFAASVWKVLVEPGDYVKTGETVMVFECMKMEYDIKAESDGVLQNLNFIEGDMIMQGQKLFSIVTEE